MLLQRRAIGQAEESQHSQNGIDPGRRHGQHHEAADINQPVTGRRPSWLGFFRNMLKHSQHRDHLERFASRQVVGEISFHELHAGHVLWLGKARINTHANEIIASKAAHKCAVAAANVEYSPGLVQVRKCLTNAPVSNNAIEPFHPSPPLLSRPSTLRKKLPSTI